MDSDFRNSPQKQSNIGKHGACTMMENGIECFSAILERAHGENARRFLAEVVNSNPTGYPVMYDLAKAEFLAGNVARAKEIVAVLKDKAPGLVETDPAFVRALGE